LRGALVTPKVKHRAAITTPKEAGALLRSIEDYDGNKLTGIALRLIPHLFVRPGELRFSGWKEFDLDKAVWTIPDHKMKMRRPHAVPLSQQALAIMGDWNMTEITVLISFPPSVQWDGLCPIILQMLH